jgi:hypothetical protein
MSCGGCGYSKRLPYDPKREMRNRRSYRRRMRNALYKENKNVLSEEGFSRSQSMGKRHAKTQESET